MKSFQRHRLDALIIGSLIVGRGCRENPILWFAPARAREKDRPLDAAEIYRPARLLPMASRSPEVVANCDYLPALRFSSNLTAKGAGI